MYVDKARILDLMELKKDMNDYTLTPFARQRAYETYRKIISQLNDKKLASMRERLHKASDAKDRYEVWKIRNQIKDYLKEETLNERTY